MTSNRTSHGWPTSALAAAEKAFTLLSCPPAPLALDGRRIGYGLPGRHIPLDELRRLLLHDRSVGYPAKDAVWGQLIDHARSWGPAWVIATVGMALPALTRMAGRLCTGHARMAEDIESELLAGFLHGLRHGDLSGPAPYVRLCWMAWRAALRVRQADQPGEVPDLADPSSHTPTRPYGHEELILGRAVAAGVITGEQAELIAATRLGRELVETVAAEQGVAASVLRMRRRRGELKLAAAMRRGDLDPASAAIRARQLHAARHRGRGPQPGPAVQKPGPAVQKPPGRPAVAAGQPAAGSPPGPGSVVVRRCQEPVAFAGADRGGLVGA
jgi:hypothetical protein